MEQDTTHTPRLPIDPHVVMVAAIGRCLARDELAALHGLARSSRRFLELWDGLMARNDQADPDLLVRWLADEGQRAPETGPIEAEIMMMRQHADDFQRCLHAQGEMNRIRLALMGDVDFPGGERWEGLIRACQDTAQGVMERKDCP